MIERIQTRHFEDDEQNVVVVQHPNMRGICIWNSWLENTQGLSGVVYWKSLWIGRYPRPYTAAYLFTDAKSAVLFKMRFG
jgi:hypothetical protein